MVFRGHNYNSRSQLRFYTVSTFFYWVIILSVSFWILIVFGYTVLKTFHHLSAHISIYLLILAAILTCGSWALDIVRWERLRARAHENTIKREQANEWASSIVVHTNNKKDMTVICEGGYIASSYLLMTRQFTYRSLYQLK